MPVGYDPTGTAGQMGGLAVEPGKRLRRRWFEILELSPFGDRVAKLVDAFIIAAILINAVAVVLATESQLLPHFGRLFRLIEQTAMAVFAVEYVARVWVSVERSQARGTPSWRARLAYMSSPMAIVDLLAVTPLLVEWWIGPQVETLSLLRLLRLLKLARYSTALGSLARVLQNEARPLLAALLIILVIVPLAASVMYFAERAEQPADFGSIPAAMWWALVTLTTLGYGDVVPVTPLGRVLAGAFIIAGLVVFALPVGIVASGFTRELNRHDFLVRWEMVARVPLFSSLDAVAVAHVVRVLRTRKIRAHDVICRAGQPGEGLLFLIDGQAQARYRRRVYTLKPGDFFGELALLRGTPHEITVVAETACRLLILEPLDFADVVRDHPAVRDHVEQVLRYRLQAIGEPAELADNAMRCAVQRWGLEEREG